MDTIPTGYQLIFFVLSIWSIFWKGVALWRAANLNQRYWFIAILILNTFGILEIVYLFRFAKKPLTLNEIRSWNFLPQSKK